MSSSWFERLTGFPEESPTQVRSKIALDGDELVSSVNGRRLRAGELTTPTLDDLRASVRSSAIPRDPPSVREIVGDSQTLHASSEAEGALFQVASQFNLLEMISPSVSPEDGVSIYQSDNTQGPACAIAAGAGTIYRNYYALVDGEPGQAEHRQIDCLEDLGELLGNNGDKHWTMKNGYALASGPGLDHVSEIIRTADEEMLERLRGSLRIGIQWDTEVTVAESGHLVSQAYCSALPVAYSSLPPEKWKPFATLVLEAAYEATLSAAVLNSERTGNKDVYLTLVGGGASGNHIDWITNAIERSLSLFEHYPLDVKIVSFGRRNPNLASLV